MIVPPLPGGFKGIAPDRHIPDAEHDLGASPRGSLALFRTGQALAGFVVDRFGALRVRLGIGRDRYAVEPGAPLFPDFFLD